MTPSGVPLAGLRVAVTRPAVAAGELAQQLREAGAAPVLLPLTYIAPPLDDAQLKAAGARLQQYDWVVFTSVNAVRACAGFWPQGAGVRTAAVGSATAAAVRELTSRDVDVIPATFGSDALVPAMLETGSLAGARVLWPRAETAGDTLRLALHRAGAILDDPIAYRTELDPAAARELVRLERSGMLDVITFTAPSAVRCYAAAAGGETQCVIAVIGATTAAAARAHGLPVHVEAEQPIIPALVAALARHHVDTSG